MRYHERTKHHFNRFAPGPGGLDWANQPDPFRRYAEAPLTRLPILKAEEEPLSPRYDSLYSPGAVASVPVSVRALSRLLEYALALSAWKQAGGTRWALRRRSARGGLRRGRSGGRRGCWTMWRTRPSKRCSALTVTPTSKAPSGKARSW